MLVIKAIRIPGQNGDRDSVEPETLIPADAVRSECDEEVMEFRVYFADEENSPNA